MAWISQPPCWNFVRPTFTEAEKLRVERLNHWAADENGYFQIQTTRPQTIGYGLLPIHDHPQLEHHNQAAKTT